MSITIAMLWVYCGYLVLEVIHIRFLKNNKVKKINIKVKIFKWLICHTELKCKQRNTPNNVIVSINNLYHDSWITLYKNIAT